LFEWLLQPQRTAPPPVEDRTNPLLVEQYHEPMKPTPNCVHDLHPKVTDIDWHGYSFKDIKAGIEESLHVGYLPGRRYPCLYAVKRTPWMDNGGVRRYSAKIVVLSHFKSEKSAIEALKWIDRLAQAFVAIDYRKEIEEEEE